MELLSTLGSYAIAGAGMLFLAVFWPFIALWQIITN